MPVAAVTCFGSPSVRLASSTAQSPIKGGELTASLTPPSQVMTEIGVASEPVPAVGGTSARGRGRPRGGLAPPNWSGSSPPPRGEGGGFGTSPGGPPPQTPPGGTR